MTFINTCIKTTGFALVLVSSFLLAPATHASTGLLDRVHEALVDTNLPTDMKTQQAYDVCVISEHYTTFDQLVNAMKWQKQHGHTTPNIIDCMNTNKVWKFTGEVTEVNKWKLETVGVTKSGLETRPKFDITNHTIVKYGVLLFDVSYQMNYDVKDEIRRGSAVTVWATHNNEALIIQNNAPHGQGDYYGHVDCPSCQVDNTFTATPDPITDDHHSED